MDIINFLQSFQTNWLTSFFKFITFFGNEEFYILILPVLFWLWKKDKALKMFFILLPSLLLNFYLKEVFHTARPVGVALIEQGGFAFPSGHAQGSVTLWLMLILLVRKKWISILAIAMVILVPLSRMYLGVHWPVDILGGLLIGVVLVWFYWVFLYENFRKYLAEKTTLGKIAVLTIIILFLVGLYPAPDALTILAVMWGFGIMLILSNVMYCPVPDGLLRKFLLLIIGLVGIILIWKGVKIILPETNLMRFVRYALLGLWTAFLPCIIHKRTS